MVEVRPLIFLSVLVLSSVCRLPANALKITGDIKKGNFRVGDEQDPMTTITLTAEDGERQSTLFSSCLDASRSFDAVFASLEVDSGAEYIRYVPDSDQLNFPLAWQQLAGSFSSIFDCAQAAFDGDWPVFKYDGAECNVAPSGYDLNDVPQCGADDSDAVFILETAVFECAPPRFLFGYTNAELAVCGLISEDLMTFDEAEAFCTERFPFEELMLYANVYHPLTVGDMIAKFTSLGYTNTNLWVQASEFVRCNIGDFNDEDFATGVTDPCEYDPFRPHSMDKDTSFKLVPHVRTDLALALCSSFVIICEGC